MLQPEMRCREFVEAVTEWLEGALDDDERLVLEEHLAICPHCLDYLGELRLAIAVLRGTADATPAAPPPAMRAALLAAFRERSGG
jgi:anti-sigma factor RsiW